MIPKIPDSTSDIHLIGCIRSNNVCITRMMQIMIYPLPEKKHSTDIQRDFMSSLNKTVCIKNLDMAEKNECFDKYNAQEKWKR